MSLKQIEVDANLRNHVKARHLAKLCEDPRAHTYLVDLWCWASQSQPDGLIPGAIAQMIVEDVVGWTGKPGKLAEAMIESRWLDVRDNGLYIHDWHDHAGAHISYAEKEAERARQWRLKQKENYGLKERTPTVHNRTRTKSVRNRTDTYENRNPIQSNPIQIEKEKPKAPNARHAPLQARLEKSFEEVVGQKYGFQRADPKAIQQLLGFTDNDDEIDRRWRAGLKASGWPHTSTIAQLASKWNEHASASATGPPKAAVDPRKGAMRAEDVDWTQTGTF